MNRWKPTFVFLIDKGRPRPRVEWKVFNGGWVASSRSSGKHCSQWEFNDKFKIMLFSVQVAAAMFYQLITNRFICSALLLVQRRCDQAVDEESWTSRSKSKSWSSGAELKSRGRVDWGKFCKQFPFSDILFHVQYRQYRWHRETVKSLMGKISRRCVW